MTRRAVPRHALELFGEDARRRGYLLKERLRSRAELTAAIRAVAAGGSIVDSEVGEQVAAARRRLSCSPLRDLTPREREVLQQVAAGKSNAAIAASLQITRRAVEKHVNAIFLKLGPTSVEDSSKRVRAVLMLLEERAILGDAATSAELAPRTRLAA